jgi:hypothetical protein
LHDRLAYRVMCIVCTNAWQVKIRTMVQRQGLVAALAVVVLGCVEAFLLPPVFATQATPLDTKVGHTATHIEYPRTCHTNSDNTHVYTLLMDRRTKPTVVHDPLSNPASPPLLTGSRGRQCSACWS